MGAVKNGIFFFLLSKLLAVNCVTPTNSVQFNEQNSGAPNSWIGQPVTSETSNYYSTNGAYPPQSTYLNNDNNQQPNYVGHSLPPPKPYNEPHHLSPPQQSTIPQQFIPQGQNIYQTQQMDKFQPPSTKTPQIPQPNSMLQIQSNTPQSLPPGSLNSNSGFVNQQSIDMQYPKLNQNVNTEFTQSKIISNYDNQQSQVPKPYDLQSKGGQGASQSSGTIKPSPPEKNQKELPTSLNPPMPEELPDFGEPPNFGQVMSNVKPQENKPVQVLSKIVPPLSQQTSFNSISDFSSNTLPPPKENQLNPSIPPISNQMPSLSYSKLLDKGPPTPITNTMQDTNDGALLKSISGFPDNKSESLISDVVQNEKVLMDNSQIDMQTFLKPENNNNLNPFNEVSKNQGNSQLELYNTPPQLPIENMEAESVDINKIQEQKLLNLMNESLFPANVIGTQLYQDSILEKAKPDLSTVLSNQENKENDKILSLDNLVFDKPLHSELSKYDKPFIVDMENPERMKKEIDQITVFADPNDVHTLLIPSAESSTSDNSYPTNYLLDSPPTDIPWYKPSFPNIVNYVQQPDFNANNRLLSPLLNVYQNPLFNNQIPMYPSSNNYYNQQDAYSAVGQNQMSSKIQLPGISRNNIQSSSKDNSGNIYRQVDLGNPPPDISNSWLLLNKDYTTKSNQNNGYTSYDGKTPTSILGTPSISYQNNNQDILNLPSNDMFVQNMMSVISNSLHVPLVGTMAIFDVTRANFPRSPLNQVIRLTHAIVQSVMRSLQQTLNTVMNTLYGRRSKRDLNPSDVLDNLPGALIDKYSQQSAPTPTDINVPYYTQSYGTGQQPILQQQQTYYGGVTDMNYYRSQDNKNIRDVSQPANTQNYVLNNLFEAVTTAIRSNLPDPYSIDTPEVKEYTYQVMMTAEIVFKNQIDNILNGSSPTVYSGK